MKKLILGAFLASVIPAFFSAQVMNHPGVENTLYTGFGDPIYGDTLYYGVFDCLQARVDVSKFTLEGMINWGAVANCDNDGNVDNFTFENTSRNPLLYLYSDGIHSENTINELKTPGYNNSMKFGQMLTDDYYVNFLWRPVTGLDVGMGTKLNWEVGPAPKYGAWLWESDAHVRQGGFSTEYDDRHGSTGKYQFTPDVPGSADVVGFVPYANKYAKKALGVRYFHKGDVTFQAGAAIPDGTNSDDFRTNAGVQFTFQKFTIASAYEGLFQKDGNFYAGAEFGIEQFFFDVYFAWDSIDTDSGDDDMSYSLGGRMTIDFSKSNISLIPEGSFNWFENTHYTPAGYAGLTFVWGIKDDWEFRAWGSFAIGSADKRWDDDEETDDWFGGNILDVRPEIGWKYNKTNKFSAYADFENRVSFDNKSKGAWSTGVYWTYSYDNSKK